MLACSQGPLLAAVLLVACTALVYRRLSNRVYLLDFSCYRPADEYQVTWKRFMAGSVDCGVSSAYSVVIAPLCSLASKDTVSRYGMIVHKSKQQTGFDAAQALCHLHCSLIETHI